MVVLDAIVYYYCVSILIGSRCRMVSLCENSRAPRGTRMGNSRERFFILVP